MSISLFCDSFGKKMEEKNERVEFYHQQGSSCGTLSSSFLWLPQKPINSGKRKNLLNLREV
jgi:hypothetical protein